MLVSYNWLVDYLGDDAPTPDEIGTLLTQHAFEIEDIKTVGQDTIIDVDVLPNRSSDCLSHRGIAREIAAIRGIPLVWDPLATTPEFDQADMIQVTVADQEACPRFTASLLQDVTVQDSPQWMQDRLLALGQRPINLIVDVTNYVMYSLGQPLHAYDADKFPHSTGVWKFVVRLAQPEETIDLLAEGGSGADRTVTLTGGELLITEGESDTPIGLAGVKGGTFAGVDKHTTAIIIEAANFDPVRTRKTARQHKIVIDASKRFENEPARELPLYAQAEALRLLRQCGGVRCVGGCDVYPNPVTPPNVSVSLTQTNALLGTALTIADITELLQRVGCTVVESAGDVLQVTGPWERTDLNLPEDMIEEIGRLHGYHRVAAIRPEPRQVAEYNTMQYHAEAVRRLLTAQGFFEVITSSFRKKDAVKLRNALASDKAFLRSRLSSNIQEALDKNIHHVDLLGVSDVRVFEIGTVFEKTDNKIVEHTSLSFGVRVRPTGYSGKEDALIMKIKQQLEELWDMSVSWTEEKGVVEIDLSEIVATLPAPTDYQLPVKGKSVTYKPFSQYPAMSRDIAVWVPSGTSSGDVVKVLEAQAGEWHQRTTLFDEFAKDGRVSFAFRLVFQAYDQTLNDVVVNECMEAIYAAVTKQGWEVR